MAKYNELLVGRYNRFLQKLLSMKGPASLESLNPELQAVFNFFNGVENRYLESWDRFGMALNVPATVAQPSVFQLRNPAGSNVIAVVEAIDASAGGTTASNLIVILQALTTDQASIDSPSPLDFRTKRGSSTLIASHGITQTGGQIRIAWVLGQTTYSFIANENQEITIIPGFVMQVQSTTINQVLGAGVVWRERFLEDSERA